LDSDPKSGEDTANMPDSEFGIQFHGAEKLVGNSPSQRNFPLIQEQPSMSFLREQPSMSFKRAKLGTAGTGTSTAASTAPTLLTQHSSTTNLVELKSFGQSNSTVELGSAGPHDQSPRGQYITGWRLHAIFFALCVGLFVGQMEVSIISTSVLSITDQLGGFEQSSWLFTAYMLTYSGLLIIWAKMSDIFGRKPMLLTSYAIFIVFSAASGAAQTIIQLIMFRWCQGVGSAGMFSLATLLFFELVPQEKWPAYTALCTGILALSLAAAPLIGGAINDNASWRWVFLLK